MPSAVRLAHPRPVLADPDPKLIQLPQLCQRVGLSRTTIYRLIRAGTFPKPIKIATTSVWATRLVDAWVEAQIAASEQ